VDRAAEIDAESNCMAYLDTMSSLPKFCETLAIRIFHEERFPHQRETIPLSAIHASSGANACSRSKHLCL